MKKNILLMGITIHVAALSVCAADVHVFDGDNAPGIAGISAVDKIQSQAEVLTRKMSMLK